MLSPWPDNLTPPSFPSLTKDVRTDVLVIGGGIAGILTAYFLHRNGIPCILAEKDKICSLTTGNTTAKITFQHSLIFQKLIRDIGEHKAKMYCQANAEALAMYKKMCRDIECDFELKTNFVYSTDNCRKLEKELEAARRLGIDMGFTDSVPLPIDTAGAVYCKNQAQFNPLKFLCSIAKDLCIYENTFIQKVEGNTAYTQGHKIVADSIVFATHFPFIDRHGFYFMKMHQSRSYVIALEGATNIDGMYIDESDKGLSFRNYRSLLFIGGSNHRTGKKSEGWEKLRAFGKEHYPDLKEKYHWAAQDCMTLDSMPYIGQYSKKTARWYVATGFGKWGMTGAMVGATLLRDIICGVDNSYAEVFSPQREMLKSQLMLNSLETVANFITPTAKRCSHLGCALKYNKHEHTWDCPCHGSRFSEDGMVIENPATRECSIARKSEQKKK